MASPIHLSAILGMLHKRPRCPHCKHLLKQSSKNCQYCGKKINQPASGQQPKK